MTEETKDIYRQLYIQTSNILSDNGKTLDCDADSFVASLGSAPKKVDLTPFMELESDKLLDALYLGFYQKLPAKDKKDFARQMSKEEILNLSVSENAFYVRDLEPINSPYGKIKKSAKGKALNLVSDIKNSMFLRKLAKKMPQSLQKKIRGTFT